MKRKILSLHKEIKRTIKIKDSATSDITINDLKFSLCFVVPIFKPEKSKNPLTNSTRIIDLSFNHNNPARSLLNSSKFSFL
jgi:hypothetical protein